MKNHVTGMLGALLLTASQAQACTGGAVDHTVYSYVFGFVPDTLYVCPGDRVRVHNKSAYDMRATVPDVQLDAEGNLQTFHTGNLAPGTYSSYFDFDASNEVVVQPQLVYYGYGSYATYPVTITSGEAPPTEYAEGERYEDPQD